MHKENIMEKNIGYGLIALAGVGAFCIGFAWIALTMSLPVGALWLVAGGASVTYLAASAITE